MGAKISVGLKARCYRPLSHGPERLCSSAGGLRLSRRAQLFIVSSLVGSEARGIRTLSAAWHLFYRQVQALQLWRSPVVIADYTRNHPFTGVLRVTRVTDGVRTRDLLGHIQACYHCTTATMCPRCSSGGRRSRTPEPKRTMPVFETGAQPPGRRPPWRRDWGSNPGSRSRLWLATRPHYRSRIPPRKSGTRG